MDHLIIFQLFLKLDRLLVIRLAAEDGALEDPDLPFVFQSTLSQTMANFSRRLALTELFISRSALWQKNVGAIANAHQISRDVIDFPLERNEIGVVILVDFAGFGFSFSVVI